MDISQYAVLFFTVVFRPNPRKYDERSSFKQMSENFLVRKAKTESWRVQKSFVLMFNIKNSTCITASISYSLLLGIYTDVSGLELSRTT